MLSLGRLHISDCLDTFSNRRKLKSATAFQNIATSGRSNLTRMAVHEASDPSGGTRGAPGLRQAELTKHVRPTSLERWTGIRSTVAECQAAHFTRNAEITYVEWSDACGLLVYRIG